MFYVYKITNLVNNKIYIGKAKSIEGRWNSHKSTAIAKIPGKYCYIHRAMNKYGFDNFIIEEIEQTETEREALDRETYYIALYHTRDHSIGYNCTDGGDGASGYRFSDEQKRLMSEKRKGKYIGDKNPFYGKTHSEETKEIISEKHKQFMQQNPEVYNKVNMDQCDFNTEQCLDIQKDFLYNEFTLEKLSEKYNADIRTIHHIIHGTYFAIRGHSIITEEQFEKIKKERHFKRTRKLMKTFSQENEMKIIDQHLKEDMQIKDIAKQHNVCELIINRVFEKYNIKIRKDLNRPNALLNKEDVLKIRELYAENKYSYTNIADMYNVTVAVISRIIRRVTWNNI